MIDPVSFQPLPSTTPISKATSAESGFGAVLQEHASPPTGEDPEKIKTAARQFESLLLGQILKSVRMGSEDESADSILEMGQEQFAQALAQNGGLGLTDVIVRNFRGQS